MAKWELVVLRHDQMEEEKVIGTIVNSNTDISLADFLEMVAIEFPGKKPEELIVGGLEKNSDIVVFITKR